jgi:hypothetical protein
MQLRALLAVPGIRVTFDSLPMIRKILMNGKCWQLMVIWSNTTSRLSLILCLFTTFLF